MLGEPEREKEQRVWISFTRKMYMAFLRAQKIAITIQSKETGLTIEETTEHMQVLNDVREYLRNV